MLHDKMKRKRRGQGGRGGGGRECNNVDKRHRAGKGGFKRRYILNRLFSLTLSINNDHTLLMK